MNLRLAIVAVVAALPSWLAGCGIAFDDDDSGGGGAAPRIESSFPGSAVQVLATDGVIDFAAAGSDEDSLVLDFSWRVDDAYQAGGSSVDGSFDVAWTLPWSAELSGASVDVEFRVTDGALETRRLWAVDVE